MSIKVRYLDNPFTGHATDHEVEHGLTYEQIVDEGDYASVVSHVAVKVDDEDVADLSAVPPDGSRVTVYGIPAGGSDEEKTQKGKVYSTFGSIFTFIGTVLVMTGVFAPIGFAMIAVGTIMSAAGALYYRSGMKGMMEDSLRDRQSPEQLPGVRGSRNQLRPYSDVPILYGTHHLVPPLAAKPFTELNGDNQYLRQLFMIGYGDIDLSDIRVAENAIANYEEFEWEVAKPGEITSLYSDTVVETNVGAALEHNDEVVRTTEGEGTELSVDIAFPRGLGAFNDDGDRVSKSVRIQGWYRVQGDTTWTSWFDKTWSSRAMETIRRTVRTTVSKDTYEVRLRRETSDSSDSQVVDSSQWGALRIVDPQDPVSSEMRDRTTRLAVRVKASGQFQGIIDKLSCTGTVALPVYSGSGSGAAEWSYTHTHNSNPASAYLFTLQGPGAKRTVADSKIDWPALEAWFATCETKGYAVNAYDQKSQTLSEQLQVIASVGHAFVVKNGGQFGVTEDQPKDPVQHFTPKNSWGFSAVKNFTEPATALNITFIDADADYKQVEMRVYYDEDNPSDSVVDDTELWGVTGEDQAWRYGRRELYQVALRRTRYSLNADFEALRCRRGDWVRVTHDVALLGLTSGRIVDVVRNGSNEVTAIELDEPLTMESGTDYAIRIRTPDDDDYLIELDNAGATVTTVNVKSGDVAEYNIEEGDLYGTREMGQLTDTYMITSIVPEDDFAAKLSLEPTEQAIFDAETGDAPAFDSRVTTLADDNTRPPTPTIALRSDGTTIKKKSDGTWEDRIAVDIYGSSGLATVEWREVQWRIDGSDDSWDAMFVDPETVEATITDVDSLATYRVRARSIASDGATSDWAEDTVQVLGKSAPPNIVSSITYAIRSGEGIQLQWARVPDKDASYYIVRVGSDWSSATTIFEGDSDNYLWENQTAGTYTVQVRAVDTSGNVATSSATVDVTIEAPGAVQNLVATVAVNGVNVSWNKPDSGTLTIDEYEILKGDTIGGATTVGTTGGRWFTISEDDTGSYTYWVRAVDAAGNVGTETSVNANVESSPVGSTTDVPDTPTLTTTDYERGVALEVSRQQGLNVEKVYQYAVTDDDTALSDQAAVTWYGLGVGSDWKDTGVTFTQKAERYYVHAPVPLKDDTDSDGEAIKVARTLYYRVRVVTIKDGTQQNTSDWSATAEGTALPYEGANVAADSITANRLTAAIIEALIANITEQITIGEQGAVGTDEEGQRRSILQRDRLRFEEIVNQKWQEIARVTARLDTRPVRFSKHLRVGSETSSLPSGAVAYYSCDEGVPIGSREGGTIQLDDNGEQIAGYTTRRARISNNTIVIGG